MLFLSILITLLLFGGTCWLWRQSQVQIVQLAVGGFEAKLEREGQEEGEDDREGGLQDFPNPPTLE